MSATVHKDAGGVVDQAARTIGQIEAAGKEVDRAAAAIMRAPKLGALRRPPLPSHDRAVAALREALQDPSWPMVGRRSVDARFANSRFLRDPFAEFIIPTLEK